MIRFDQRGRVQGLLAATALALGLLAEGAAPAYAGSVTVTGANGGIGGYYLFARPGSAGGAANASATTTKFPSDLSNTATATGGAGGTGFAYSVYPCLVYPCQYGASGGAGGLATATATTTISGTGAALAEATSTGGIGGRGGLGTRRGGTGGTGGNATSSATASTGGGSASATATSTGGAGGAGGPIVFGPGTKGAGGTGGTASARSDAKNASGEALATASAPGGPVSAVSNFAIGSRPEQQAAIVAGRVVSDAKRTPGGSVIGYGTMSAGSGASGAATALFDFRTTVSEALDLNLLSDSFVGSSDTVRLQVVAGGKTTTYDFSNTTFPKRLQLGTIAAGNRTVSLSFGLTGGNGFGFAYDFADGPVARALTAATSDFGASPTATIPEPSTWAMLLIGFAGLAYASYRASENALLAGNGGGRHENWQKWRRRSGSDLKIPTSY